MKKVCIAALCIIGAVSTEAQQTRGTVVYERTMHFEVQVAENDAMERALPRTRTDRFQLQFGNGLTLWKHLEEEEAAEDVASGGMLVRMFGQGTDDIVFHDLNRQNRVEQREVFGKQFLVMDTIAKLRWQLSDETKMILNHSCRKAVAQRIGKRSMMTLNNGKMERKETADTSTVIAWFTSDVPVSTGPEIQGQLPGLILALDINDGRITYRAVELGEQVQLAALTPPTKGRKVDAEGFNAERNKLMEAMQQNQQGGNTRIMIRN